ncbi:hypothetical protein RJ639_030978 [Escallonia herrerae]|uniref:Uncharacterized protein n=1 Tax=Escallonia herrerae TaxID=1293975 RepID=A0AA88WYC6_9ASTE|nr:hypothetical protein RJ639_030978 [Escallonia herrerae]
MNSTPIYVINGFQKADGRSLWKWKGIKSNRKKDENRLSITGFLQENGRKIEEAVMGPGGGAGVGCGAGIGLGVVGGVGYGGWPWNHVRLAFGVGIGCGVGVGFGYGYGQGIGLGFSLDSLRSHLSKPNPKSKKRVTVRI